MPEEDNVPSPGTDPQVFRLTDEGIAKFIQFPEDTIFLESLADNEVDRNVGYLVLQRTTGPNGQPESWLYKVRPEMEEAEELFGPLATEGGTQTSIFGSALSTDLILYLCCFNRNSLIAFDLKKKPPTGKPVKCIVEIPDLPSPNDVCFDPKNEKILYVCGGTFRSLGCATLSDPAYGQVFKITLNDDGTAAKTEVVQKGLEVLSGIEVVGNNVWVAELFNVVILDETDNYKRTVQWKGEAKKDEEGKVKVWLADNMDLFEYSETEHLMLCPAYSTMPESTVDTIMKNPWAASTVLLVYQLLTCCMRHEGFREALLDPEVSLRFSNTYIQYDKHGNEKPTPPIRIFMMSPDGKKAYHFEIELKETLQKYKPWNPMPKKKRHYFNEQVTHAAHLKSADGKSGYVVCVNFEEPRLLLLKDEKFKECIRQKNEAE